MNITKEFFEEVLKQIKNNNNYKHYLFTYINNICYNMSIEDLQKTILDEKYFHKDFKKQYYDFFISTIEINYITREKFYMFFKPFFADTFHDKNYKQISNFLKPYNEYNEVIKNLKKDFSTNLDIEEFKKLFKKINRQKELQLINTTIKNNSNNLEIKTFIKDNIYDCHFYQHIDISGNIVKLLEYSDFKLNDVILFLYSNYKKETNLDLTLSKDKFINSHKFSNFIFSVSSEYVKKLNQENPNFFIILIDALLEKNKKTHSYYSYYNNKNEKDSNDYILTTIFEVLHHHKNSKENLNFFSNILLNNETIKKEIVLDKNYDNKGFLFLLDFMKKYESILEKKVYRFSKFKNEIEVLEKKYINEELKVSGKNNKIKAKEKTNTFKI